MKHRFFYKSTKRNASYPDSANVVHLHPFPRLLLLSESGPGLPSFDETNWSFFGRKLFNELRSWRSLNTSGVGRALPENNWLCLGEGMKTTFSSGSPKFQSSVYAPIL